MKKGLLLIVICTLLLVFAGCELGGGGYITVRFEANGGEPAPGSQRVQKDGMITLPAEMEMQGFVHTGWYIDPACTVIWNFERDTVSENMTLYARWRPEGSVRSGGGGGGPSGGGILPPGQNAITMSTIGSGSGTATASPNPAEAGELVTITAAASGGSSFKEWTVVSGGVTLSSTTTNPATFIMPAGAVTINAEFEALPPGTPNLTLSPVTFDGITVGDAQPLAETITITNTGDVLATVSGITLSGTNPGSFTLGGTLTPTVAAAGGTATFTVRPNASLAAGTYSATITVTYDGGATATTNVSIVVSAASGFTVTFNSNGGGTAPSAIAGISPGSSITLPVQGSMSNTGYAFAGWMTNATVTVGTNYYFGASYPYTPPGDITLYARWISLIPEMVSVGAGSFVLGYCPQTPEPNAYSISLSAFSISRYQVTQAQYEHVMGTGINPSSFNTGNEALNRPVEMVTWFDAVEFCNKLTALVPGLTPVYTIENRSPATGYPITSADVTANFNATGYRLPTESEWEFAAKGGPGTPGNYIYSGSNNIDDVAWYSGNNTPNGTKPVGLKAPNGLGIYDMSGNVWEWCWNRWGSYPLVPDHTGPTSGANRVFRGGSWNYAATFARSALRDGDVPDNWRNAVGFRLVRLP